MSEYDMINETVVGSNKVSRTNMSQYSINKLAPSVVWRFQDSDNDGSHMTGTIAVPDMLDMDISVIIAWLNLGIGNDLTWKIEMHAAPITVSVDPGAWQVDNQQLYAEGTTRMLSHIDRLTVPRFGGLGTSILTWKLSRIGGDAGGATNSYAHTLLLGLALDIAIPAA